MLRRGLIHILEQAKYNGLASKFCDILKSRITAFLSQMKEKGVLDESVNIECEITPNELMLLALDSVSEIEDLEDSYVKTVKTQNIREPGVYGCEHCQYRAVYNESFLSSSSGNLVCPICSHGMLYIHSIDFDPMRLWDVEDIIEFDIKFKDSFLNEIVAEAQEKVGGDLLVIDSQVEYLDDDRDFEIQKRRSLEKQYKSELSIPKLWSNILECVVIPDHEDFYIRTCSWILALAKAYGVIEDFFFSVDKLSDGSFSVSLRYVDKKNRKLNTPVVSNVPAIDATYDFMVDLFILIMRKLWSNGVVDRDLFSRIQKIVTLVKARFPDIAEQIAITQDTAVMPKELLRNFMDVIINDLEPELKED